MGAFTTELPLAVPDVSGRYVAFAAVGEPLSLGLHVSPCSKAGYRSLATTRFDASQSVSLVIVASLVDKVHQEARSVQERKPVDLPAE